MAIATNQQTAQAIASLTQDPNITLWLPSSVEFSADAQHYDNSLREHLASIWEQHQAFVFCLAAGAVVRLIAPLLQHKAQDPAVVVIDARGDYVISLCSGHQGKADLLAQAIARALAQLQSLREQLTIYPYQQLILLGISMAGVREKVIGRA